MRRARTLHALAAVAALGLLAGACGDDDDTTADAGSEATDLTETTEGAGTTEPATSGPDDQMSGGAAAGAALVEVVDSDLGEILASDGRTLYVFLPDEGGASTCYDDCAANWPPLMAEGGGADVAVGEGLDAALFGTAPRDDGGEQVTVDGWPLYFYAADAQPGDVLGQGVGDIWYVVAPDGTAVRD